VELLIRRIRGREDAETIDKVLDHRLIERQSTAPPAGGGGGAAD
jgi:DNA-binding LacI/PurR family transcriptional regulator